MLGAGIAFAVLVIAGNAMQGSTPALHGDADAVVAYYMDKPTRLAIAMAASVVSLFFLTWFLSTLARFLDRLSDRLRALSCSTTAASS